MKLALSLVFVLVSSFMASAQPPPLSLSGSPESVDYQEEEVRKLGFAHLHNAAQIGIFIDEGILMPILGHRHEYGLYQVSFPFARPRVRNFVEILAEGYLVACGEIMFVTSLTRPTSLQPENSHIQSVHPTGMAVDLREPANDDCREWLEERLLSMEKDRKIEATRERVPPHYHVVVLSEDF
jgi:hypothetical protein